MLEKHGEKVFIRMKKYISRVVKKIYNDFIIRVSRTATAYCHCNRQSLNSGQQTGAKRRAIGAIYRKNKR